VADSLDHQFKPKRIWQCVYIPRFTRSINHPVERSCWQVAGNSTGSRLYVNWLVYPY
jgi:hypothetical protein